MLVSNPNDVFGFDIRDFLSDEEIRQATSDRQLSDDDWAFWSLLLSVSNQPLIG